MASPIDIHWHGIYIVTTHREGGLARVDVARDKMETRRKSRGTVAGLLEGVAHAETSMWLGCDSDDR